MYDSERSLYPVRGSSQLFAELTKPKIGRISHSDPTSKDVRTVPNALNLKDDPGFLLRGYEGSRTGLHVVFPLPFPLRTFYSRQFVIFAVTAEIMSVYLILGPDIFAYKKSEIPLDPDFQTWSFVPDVFDATGSFQSLPRCLRLLVLKGSPV